VFYFYRVERVSPLNTVNIGDTLARVAETLLKAAGREPGVALLVVAGAVLLPLLLSLVALWRVSHLMKARHAGQGNSEGLQDFLRSEVQSVASGLRSDVERAGQSAQENASALRACLQRTGLVRYDAFPGVGGEQSFSLALLDAEGSGLVITGLYGRHDMRVYAKPVVAGSEPATSRGEHGDGFVFSDEERQAVAMARSGQTVKTGERATSSGRRR
jgi:hypothetical protein